MTSDLLAIVCAPSRRGLRVGADNKVRSAAVIVADPKESAIAKAHQLVSEHDVERWAEDG